MKRWHFKAAAQGLIALLPYRQRVNRVFQTRVSRTLDLSPPRMDYILQSRLTVCAHELALYRQHTGGRPLPDVIVQIGTGWFPVVPLGLYLCGANTVHSFDIQDLIRREYALALLRRLADYPLEDLALILPQIWPDRLAAFKALVADADRLPLPDFFARLGLRLTVDDATRTAYPDDSVGWVISNSTLEHIPPAVLTDLLREMRRILTEGGLMCHQINMGDHYAGDDASITPYNFLRYDAQTWRWYNNALTYQNRLRISDYRTLHTDAAFRIVEEEVRGADPAALDRVPLAADFRHYTRADLLPVRCWLVSVPV